VPTKESSVISDPRAVAYLVSQYPAYSHAFIDSEIQALRGLGWSVQPLSINPSGIPAHPDTATTVSVLGAPRVQVLRTAVRFAVRHPRALATVARRALAYAAGRGSRPRRTLWQLFYLGQAIFFHRELSRRGLRHVHVHFANNGADVGRLIADLGNAAGTPGGRWTWSMTVHGPTDFAQADQLGLAEKVASAAFVTCISEYGAAELRRRSDPAHGDKVHVVRMGIGEPTADLARPPREPDPDVFKVLFVGRLVPAKGPDVLVEALRALAAEAPEDAGAVEVVVIGDGPLRASLEESARDLPAGVDVSWLGARDHDEVLTWYRWADVFCLPSYSEGLPVVLMEALAAGLPAITTPVAGIPELVVDGVTGLLVPPGDRVALTDALQRLRRDAALRDALGEAGAIRVAQNHRADRNAGVLGELLEKTTAARG
jgi:colanic acid/amylovoran biosynthesis glycosyltransferase